MIQQPNVIATLLDRHADKPRYIFVHIPKCAGTDLRERMAHLPQLHNTIDLPDHTPPERLAKLLQAFNDKIADAPAIFISGHFRLRWVLDRKMARPGDRLFTVVREPRQMLVSAINYVIMRLCQDPIGAAPDTRGFLRRYEMTDASGMTPEQIGQRVISLIGNAASNMICTSLGNGTADRAMALIRETDIEITTTEHYLDWAAQSFGRAAVTHANQSVKVVKPGDLSEELVQAKTGEDQVVYDAVRAAMAGRLSVTGVMM